MAPLPKIKTSEPGEPFVKLEAANDNASLVTATEWQWIDPRNIAPRQWVERPLTYGVVQTEHGSLEVVLKRFRRTKFLPDQGGYNIAPLAGEIVLPPLDADATPYWRPAYDAHDAARQAAAELKPAPKRAEREPQFSYSLVKQ